MRKLLDVDYWKHQILFISLVSLFPYETPSFECWSSQRQVILNLNIFVLRGLSYFLYHTGWRSCILLIPLCRICSLIYVVNSLTNCFDNIGCNLHSLWIQKTLTKACITKFPNSPVYDAWYYTF